MRSQLGKLHDIQKIFISSILLTLTYPRGWQGRCRKNSGKEKKKGEGGEKIVHTAPRRAEARTRDLLRTRRESLAARHGGCLDKQAFLRL